MFVSQPIAVNGDKDSAKKGKLFKTVVSQVE